GRPHMLTSNQRGRGQEPVTVLGSTRVVVAVNMEPPPDRQDGGRYHTRRIRRAGSSLQVLAQPAPGFRLHLRVELVRGVVETGAQALGKSRLRIAGGELLEAGADA